VIFAAKLPRNAPKTSFQPCMCSLSLTTSKCRWRPICVSAKLFRLCRSCYWRRTVSCTWCMSRCWIVSAKKELIWALASRNVWLWSRTSSKRIKRLEHHRWKKIPRLGAKSLRRLLLTTWRSRTIRIRWRRTRSRWRVLSKNLSLRSREKFKSSL
jgi:hypothetical protein